MEKFADVGKILWGLKENYVELDVYIVVYCLLLN